MLLVVLGAKLHLERTEEKNPTKHKAEKTQIAFVIIIIITVVLIMRAASIRMKYAFIG